MTDFALPRIMLAPNGASRSQTDHPALPVSIAEIVACACECHALGVDGLHAHVRDPDGRHVLDIGLYRELLQELAVQAPGLRVQVTSEAAGRYQAHEQQTIIRALAPPYVSVALREMLRTEGRQDYQQARDFYHWAAGAGTRIQHIVYSAQDLQAWFRHCESGMIPADKRPHVLFVLGRYHQQQQSNPEDLQPFLDVLAAHPDQELDWAVCAFGSTETACLLAAHQQGGKLRIGFENSLWHADGSVAKNNQERVQALLALLKQASNCK